MHNNKSSYNVELAEDRRRMSMEQEQKTMVGLSADDVISRPKRSLGTGIDVASIGLNQRNAYNFRTVGAKREMCIEH